MSESRPERSTGGATFRGATSRGPGRPPVALLLFVLAIGSLIALGLGGRVGSGGPSTSAPAALASSGVALASGPAASDQPSHSVLPSETMRPAVTSGPGPLVLVANRSSISVYVHGDVFAPRVTWIYVALRDLSGTVVGWTSVSVPDPGPEATVVKGERAPILFDVELAVPDEFPGTLLVLAHAHDPAGAVVGTAELEVAP